LTAFEAALGRLVRSAVVPLFHLVPAFPPAVTGFAMQFLARLFLAFACLLGGSLAAMADELPKDTSKIESLTPAQARKLVAEFKGGGLGLQGLTTLDADTAKVLAEFKCQLLDLNGLTTLDVATAKALSEFKGACLDLNGLTTLDAAIAKALSDFKGQQLRLNGLTALESDTAKALAEFKGPWLILNGLTTLDSDAAEALAKFKGQLVYVNGLATLDADAAAALAASKKWDGRLPQLTAFESPDSVAIAQALATRKGPLWLPNLKKISPKTLSALIAKEDVQIPVIETLELIQEPDGSVTEDFVIPSRLEERQKEQ
jgi:hypothetical protein